MQENVIRVVVKDRTLTAPDYIKPTRYSVDHDFVEFVFGENSEWAELTKHVTFYNDFVSVSQIPYADKLKVPAEVLRYKSFRVTIEGSEGDTDRLLTATMASPIKVEESGKNDGDAPVSPSKTLLTKLTDLYNDLMDKLQSGFFKGDPGEDADIQAADEATERANTAASRVDGAIETAERAAQAANNAANNISQRADSGEFNGAPFSISYTPTSIADMNAITGAKQGEFAVINSNVEDPDNAKLFMFGNGTWNLMSDLSGATGFGLQGKQGVSLKSVKVINQTQVEVTQYDPMTEQERTYVIGDFAAPLAAGVSGYVDSKWQVVDAMPENPVPGVIYFVRE